MSTRFEFPAEALSYLDRLKNELGAQSRGEVLRHALAVMGWAVEKRKQGCEVTAIPRDDEISDWIELSDSLLDRLGGQTMDGSI